MQCGKIWQCAAEVGAKDGMLSMGGGLQIWEVRGGCVGFVQASVIVLVLGRRNSAFQPCSFLLYIDVCHLYYFAFAERWVSLYYPPTVFYLKK